MLLLLLLLLQVASVGMMIIEAYYTILLNDINNDHPSKKHCITVTIGIPFLLHHLLLRDNLLGQSHRACPGEEPGRAALLLQVLAAPQHAKRRDSVPH